MKDLKISKELIEEVMKDKGTFETIKNEFIIAHSNLGMKMVNIYEFVFIKCKEWALNKNYTLLSSIEIDCAYCDISFIINNKAKHKLITDDSEVEAILKACQWILNNKES